MTKRISPPTQPASERESLEAWLEFHRATLLMKCEGLTPEQLATTSVAPSQLSLIGLVRHLTGVEPWFHAFDGQPDMEMFEEEDAFEPAIEHVERDFANYQLSVERARRAAAAHHLDDVVDQHHWVADDQPKVVRPTSLRWVYQHMIEEYARHNGHADLIRERIDGVTGD
ncbi:MAG TPA: DinB family protein [Streptosporangiaceae bacterium]